MAKIEYLVSYPVRLGKCNKQGHELSFVLGFYRRKAKYYLRTRLAVVDRKLKELESLPSQQTDIRKGRSAAKKLFSELDKLINKFSVTVLKYDMNNWVTLPGGGIEALNNRCPDNGSVSWWMGKHRPKPHSPNQACSSCDPERCPNNLCLTIKIAASKSGRHYLKSYLQVFRGCWLEEEEKKALKTIQCNANRIPYERFQEIVSLFTKFKVPVARRAKG